MGGGGGGRVLQQEKLDIKRADYNHGIANDHRGWSGVWKMV